MPGRVHWAARTKPASPRCETIDALQERIFPHGIIDHLHTTTVRQAFHFLLKILLGVKDDRVGTGRCGNQVGVRFCDKTVP